MCLGHIYIVLKPVGSARLTFDDDSYYELCDLMYQRLFGVPDEITDMIRSLKNVQEVKIDILEGYIRTPEWFREVSDKFRSTGGYWTPPPPGEVMGLSGPLGEREGRTRRCPPHGESE